MICVKMEKTWKLRKIKSKRKSQLTIHRTGKTTQQKKKKFENPREIFLELKGMHFISIKSQCVEKSIFFKKSLNQKNIKLFSVKLNKGFFF